MKAPSSSPPRLEAYLRSHYTAETVCVYLRYIGNYTSNCKEAQKATYSDVVAYLGLLRGRYPLGTSLHKMLSAIKAYYTWLCVVGLRTDNPARSIRLRDKQSKDIQLQDLLSEAELEQLLERTDTRGLLSSRNKVLTSLLIYQGLSLMEIHRLAVGDIDLPGGQLYVRPTLVTNSRWLPLRARQAMFLQEYMQQTRPLLLSNRTQETKALLPCELLVLSERGMPMPPMDLSKHVKRWYGHLQAGKKINAKTIRQSVITNLLKKGTDLRLVQSFAGHKHPATTERYRQTDVDALKAAVVKYHPFA